MDEDDQKRKRLNETTKKKKEKKREKKAMILIRQHKPCAQFEGKPLERTLEILLTSTSLILVF